MFKVIATASAIVSLAYSAAAIAAPTGLSSLYGVSLDPAGVWLVRLIGSAYLGYAVLAGLARAAHDASTRRVVAATQATGWGAGFLVTVVARTTSGYGNDAAWMIVVLAAVFAVGWAYALMAERPAPAAARA